MANRLDALSVRETNGKAYFTRLGVAFENKNGDGWNLLLDAIPAPVDGQFKIMLKPPQDKTGGPGDDRRGSSSSGGGRQSHSPDDDGIPFLPCR